MRDLFPAWAREVVNVRYMMTSMWAFLIGGASLVGYISFQQGHLDAWLPDPMEGRTYANCGMFTSMHFKERGIAEMRSEYGFETYNYQTLPNGKVELNGPILRLIYDVTPNGTLIIIEEAFDMRSTTTKCVSTDRH